MKFDVKFRITLLCHERIELTDPDVEIMLEDVIQSEIENINLGIDLFKIIDRETNIIEIIRVGEPKDDEYELYSKN